MGARHGLALESRHEVRSPVGVRVKNLYRDRFPQVNLFPAVDGAHAPFTEDLVNEVATRQELPDERRSLSARARRGWPKAVEKSLLLGLGQTADRVGVGRSRRFIPRQAPRSFRRNGPRHRGRRLRWRATVGNLDTNPEAPLAQWGARLGKA